MAGRLFRRGDVWYCWGFDANGNRWRESTQQTDREAARVISIQIVRRRASEAGAQAPLRLVDALDAARAAAVRGDRSEAVKGILALKGRHLVTVLGADYDVRRVRREDLTRYVDQRLKEGVSRHTIHKELAALRRACRVSQVGWSSEMMPDLGRFYVPRERWLTPEQYRALLPHLAPFRSDSVDRRDYLTAFVFSGARLSELLGLERDDVDAARGLLRIRGSKTERSDRWVPIADELRPVLVQRVEASRTPGQRPNLFAPWHMIIRDLERACVRARVVKVTPNDLRRTFCSWLANAGVGELVAARLMGHASTKMVSQVYARLGVAIQHDAVARLSGYAGGTDAVHR